LRWLKKTYDKAKSGGSCCRSWLSYVFFVSFYGFGFSPFLSPGLLATKKIARAASYGLFFKESTRLGLRALFPKFERVEEASGSAVGI